MFKRSFWTVSRGVARGRVLIQNHQGLIFKNNNLSVVLQQYGVNNNSVINWSLGKLPPLYEVKLLVGKTVECEYHCDLIGNPLIGDVIEPIYITSIKEVNE